MKFTDGQEEPVDKSISILRIQHELDYLLDMESSNETVFNWIVVSESFCCCELSELLFSNIL